MSYSRIARMIGSSIIGLAVCSLANAADAAKGTVVLEVLKNSKRVLWLAAHPDDETSSSALLARAKDLSGSLFMASMTRGENSDKVWGKLRRGTQIGEARAKLFAQSAALFQADDYELGPFVNGPYSLAELDALPADAPHRDWPATATSDDVIAKWSREGDPVGYIVSLLRKHRPDVVISMDDHCGVSGHDEHIAVARLLLRAIPIAADASAYQEAGEPWQVRYVIFAAAVARQLVACRYCKCEGAAPPEPVEAVFTLDKSRTHHMTYLEVQCLIGRNYQNAMEAKGWSDRQMRAGCEQAQAAVMRAYRNGVKGPPFFESFRHRSMGQGQGR